MRPPSVWLAHPLWPRVVLVLVLVAPTVFSQPHARPISLSCPMLPSPPPPPLVRRALILIAPPSRPARPSSSPPPPPPPVVMSRLPHPSPSSCSCFFRAPEVAVRLAGWCGQPVAWVCGPMPSNAEHGEGGTCAPKCRSAEPKEAVGGRAQSPGADVGGQRPAAQGAVLRAVLIAHGSRAHLVCI